MGRLTNIDFKSLKDFDGQHPENLYIIYIGSSDKDILDQANLNIWYTQTDLSMTPTEISECNITTFTWNLHGILINNTLKEIIRLESHDSLLIVSKDGTIEAAGLALAISESRLIRGKSTQDLVNKCIAEVDLNVILEFLGLKPELFTYAKSTYPKEAKELTRYELLGLLLDEEIYEQIFNKMSPYRTEPIDFKNLIL